MTDVFIIHIIIAFFFDILYLFEILFIVTKFNKKNLNVSFLDKKKNKVPIKICLLECLSRFG